MARSFSPGDAQRLMDKHRKYIEFLKGIAQLEEHYKNNVAAAVNQIVEKEARKLLKDIPIEEVNRDKRGIKVKTLRDNGYDTIAAIAGASIRQIASINGIGEESAHTIYQIVQEIVAQTGKTVKIRLNLDNKTADTTHMVLAISKYRRCLPFVGKSNILLEKYGNDIAYAIVDLTPGASRLDWFFTSGKNKRRAEHAYTYLSSLEASEYFERIQEIQVAYRNASQIQAEQAWEYFQEAPVSFYNVLEEIRPGVLGTDDKVYGLPEELARVIQNQPVYIEGLKCTLRRYQEWGVKYILHQKRVLLGDEMGLGKTVQAIATMVSLHNTEATHFMVVCPDSVMSNWCREVKKHSLLSVTEIHGYDRKDELQEWLEKGGVAVTTYETTAHIKLAEDLRFAMLVVDEAHYIKNPQARRTMNVKEISTHAENLLFMTGTALENRVDEMINLIEVLQPEVAFEAQKMTYLSSAPQFREKIAPVYYRRKREDVLTELPDLIESKEWCVLKPAEEAVYEEAVLSNRFADARRVSWSVDDLKDSSKAERLLEIVEEAEDDGRKVIVFSFFLDTIDKVCRLLDEKVLEPINGSVPPGRRQEIIDEFDKAPAGTVLAAQIQSGGTGLNIQSASVIILCEPQFKPSTENQAVSRAYRMGQTRNVLVYRLLCDDTVDERIVDILEEKQRIFDAFADKSAVGEESLELDEKTFGTIMQEEIQRISDKKASDSKKSGSKS